MSGLGLALLAAVGIGIAVSGLPAFVVLLAGALAAAVASLAGGSDALALWLALPNRILNLLETDILQALPLFVFIGGLLQRLGLADALLRCLGVLTRGRGGLPLSGIALGALLAPLNGSVGASVLALNSALAPRLAQARPALPPAERQALVAIAATFGVVVPPSLVLILLGDALLTAHTIALNASGRADRIINTQDVFRAALLPAALVLLLSAIWAAWRYRQRRGHSAVSPARSIADDDGGVANRPTPADWAAAALTVAGLGLMLGGVAGGWFYAVEAAAMAGVALLAAGLVTRRLSRATLRELVDRTLAGSGALFALLVAATTFTLALRVLGTDRLVAAWIGHLAGSTHVIALQVLLALAATAFVLDAFEIIFVVVPLLIPPLLVRVPDATWVAALILLTLQASFVLPPFGYALLLARSAAGTRAIPIGATVRAIGPFFAIIVAAFVLVFAVPRLVHQLDPAVVVRAPPRASDVDDLLREMVPAKPSRDDNEPDPASPR